MSSEEEEQKFFARELGDIKTLLSRHLSVLEKIESLLAKQIEDRVIPVAPFASPRSSPPRVLRGTIIREEGLHWPLQDGLDTLKAFKGEPVAADEVAKNMGVSRSRASEILNDLFRLRLIDKIHQKRFIKFKPSSKAARFEKKH